MIAIEQAKSARSGASEPGAGWLEEVDLVESLKRGDESAFEQLVRREGGRMLVVARRYLGDEEAQDAVQEAFVSAFKAIARFDGKAKLSTWLHRIVVNACLMRIRKARSKLEQAMEPLEVELLDGADRPKGPMAWPETPEQLLGRREVRQVVRRTIGELPDSYRTVLLLRDIEGRTGQETAEALGISTNAVKVRLHRARLALKERLDQHLFQGE